MATRAKVEHLFATAYYQRVFTQLLGTMEAGMSQVVTAMINQQAVEEQVESEQMLRMTQSARAYVKSNIIDVLTDIFAAEMTDEEIGQIQAMVELPIQMRLLDVMETNIPAITNWYAANSDTVAQLLQEGFDREFPATVD